MASALVDGLLAKGTYTKDRISCIGGAEDNTADLLAKRTGVRKAKDLPDLLKDADVVVVAFKPQHLSSADPRLADLTAGKLVISILAGKPLAQLEKKFSRTRALVRTMPNTPAAIGAGITGWSVAKPLSESDRSAVLGILDAIGKQVEVPESEIDALMAVSSCGPAYLFEFAGALREAGIAAGLDRATSQLLAIEMLLGSAKLLAQSGAEPEDLRNQVTSPNGTTFAALKRFEAHHFRDMVKDAILAAKARSEELSREA